MNRTNLMPPARRAAFSRSKAIRRWSVVVAGNLFLAASAGGAAALVAAQEAGVDGGRVRGDLAAATSELAAIRQDQATERANLDAVLEIADQPDWSIFFGVLSRTLGDDVVLNAIESGGAAAGQPERFAIRGVGRSQPAISQFVLRLETLGLFGRVDLVQTSPQTIAGTEGIGFKIDCSLAGGGR